MSGAEATGFDDSSWSDIGLPHSFNLPTFLNAKFYAGYGWYRKHFAVPATWSSKNVFLEFQAAFDQAQIYVNGKAVESTSAATTDSRSTSRRPSRPATISWPSG